MRLGLGALGLVILALIAMQVLMTAAHREPESRGIRLSEWMRGRNRTTFDLTRPDTVKFIRGFGREAIPLLIEAHRNAHSTTTLPRRSVFKKQRHTLTASDIKIRALTGLVVLGQEYPGDVDPYIRSRLSTTDRSLTIPFLGFLGPRYFDAVTNIIATGSLRDVQLIGEQLGKMKDRGPDAIPVVLQRSMKEWAGVTRSLDPLRLLNDLRPLPQSTIDQLLAGLANTNSQVFRGCHRSLSQIPHARNQMRDALWSILTTNQPGSVLASHAIGSLVSFDVPNPEIVPLAKTHLEALIVNKTTFYEYGRIVSFSQALLMSRDAEAEKFVRDQVFPFLRTRADSTKNPDPMDVKMAEQYIKQIQEFQRRLSRMPKP
ncbi:MAG: hypothetical protein ACPGVU_24065 [Limisphaerales bacterium]